MRGKEGRIPYLDLSSFDVTEESEAKRKSLFMHMRRVLLQFALVIVLGARAGVTVSVR